jgi:hypothetical protein
MSTSSIVTDQTIVHPIMKITCPKGKYFKFNVGNTLKTSGPLF